MSAFFSMKAFSLMLRRNARILFWDQPQCEMLNTAFSPNIAIFCFFLPDKKKKMEEPKRINSNIFTAWKRTGFKKC